MVNSKIEVTIPKKSKFIEHQKSKWTTMAEISDLSSPNCNETPKKSNAISTRNLERWKENVLCGEDVPPVKGQASLCERIYESLGNSKKVLVTLSIGLKNDNN